jgi:hypothetical protein
MNKQAYIFLISLIVCIYITPTLSISSKTGCDPENHKKSSSLKEEKNNITKKKSLKEREKLNGLLLLLKNENIFKNVTKEEFSKLEKDKKGLLCKDEMKKYMVKTSPTDDIRPPNDEEFNKLWDYIPKEDNQKCISIDGFRFICKLLVKNYIVYLRRLIQIIEIKEFLSNSEVFEGVSDHILKRCDKDEKGKLDKEGVSKAINLMCDYLNINKPNSVQFEDIYRSIPKKNGVVELSDCRSSMKVFLSKYISA